jgi:hypothetical protein
VRCGLCGNENADTNYYCGMCGGALVRKNQAPAATPAPVAVPGAAAPRQNSAQVQAQAPTQVMRAATQQVRQSAPVEPARPPRLQADVRTQSPKQEDFVPAITGPSFLGLNVTPARRSPGREAASVDLGGRDFADRDSPAHASRHDSLRSSGSVDYLLEDEEEPKRGWGKLLAVVIALALVGGLGYLRWKRGGFDWLLADKKPAVSAEQTASNPGTDVKGSTPDAATGGGVAPAAAAAQTPSAAPSPASNDATSPAAASATAGAATPSASDSSPSPNAQTDTQSPASAAGQQTGAASPAADSGSQPAQAAAATAPAQTAQDTDSDESAPAEAPSVSKRLQRKPTPSKPLDSVAEAERYIYGNAVRQDCDRGLRLLKPAAQTNARAMISMGTLYSTGTCTPRDLPTAYRWFAMALHKEPDNLPLQNDLQKLWSQMTQPERQLAIKLSQ